jgi:hypothetical protein
MNVEMVPAKIVKLVEKMMLDARCWMLDARCVGVGFGVFLCESLFILCASPCNSIKHEGFFNRRDAENKQRTRRKFRYFAFRYFATLSLMCFSIVSYCDYCDYCGKK